MESLCVCVLNAWAGIWDRVGDGGNRGRGVAGKGLRESEEEKGDPQWEDGTGAVTSLAFFTTPIFYSPGLRNLNTLNMPTQRRAFLWTKMVREYF